MSVLPVRKIYVDTKYKTVDSVSNSHFKIQLPETILLPERTVFYIDDICIPHSFYTIETGVNDKFYVNISSTEPNEDIRPFVCYVLTLTSQNYTGAELATHLAYLLNTREGSNNFTFTYSAGKQSITITTTVNNKTFKILTTNDITSSLNGDWAPFDSSIDSYDITNPMDVNSDILKLSEGNSVLYNSSTPFISKYINLNSIRNIYITSPNLGNYNTFGPNGERSIIKKVPVDSDFNYMIFNNVLTGLDHLDCSKQTLRQIEFKLQDVSGNVINLHGVHVSFSIIFDLRE
jgi:hypothetical protein